MARAHKGCISFVPAIVRDESTGLYMGVRRTVDAAKRQVGITGWLIRGLAGDSFVLGERVPKLKLT